MLRHFTSATLKASVRKLKLSIVKKLAFNFASTFILTISSVFAIDTGTGADFKVNALVETAAVPANMEYPQGAP